MLETKLDVIEDKYGLSIQFSWFNPAAYFLIFFCIAWNSFLFFWYTNLGIGAPWIAYVFPIGHVAVGISLIYYTLCLFFNKTYIDVDDKHLWIHHAPIPWWRGNADISVDEIDQIFVKEKRHKGEDSVSYTYKLLAKLRDGSTKKLLDTGMPDSERAIELEQLIENYLGIKDSPVRGEYGVSKDVPTGQPQRRQKRRLSARNSELIGKREGDIIDFNGSSCRVLHDTQYDWKNGNSDKLLQLSDTLSESILVYIRQNKGVHDIFIEEKLSLYQSNEITFNEAQPANQFQFQDTQYQLHDFLEGETFLSDQQDPISTKQWLYQSATGQQNIRIISNDNMLTYYMSKNQDMDYFDLDDSQLFDLDTPQKEILNIWDKEDLA